MNRIWRVALNKVIPKPRPFYPVFSPNDVFIGLYRRRAWKRALPSSGSIVFTPPRYSFYMFKNGKLLCVCEIFYLFSTVCFHISKHKLCQACKKNRFAPTPLPPKKAGCRGKFYILNVYFTICLKWENHFCSMVYLKHFTPHRIIYLSN